MLSRVVLFTFLVVPAVCLSAQPTLKQGPRPTPSPALTPDAMPPEVLFAFALSHSGAGEVPGDRWHIKATFDVLTSIVTAKYTTGTYEETWYAPQNYQRTYTFKGVTQTDVATPDGLFRSGDQSWPTLDEVFVRNLLVKPLPTDPLDPGTTLQVKDVNFGKIPVPCLFEVRNHPVGLSKKDEEALVDHAPRMCFDPNAPVLRFTAGIAKPPYEIAFTGVVNLHGHLVAQNISLGIGSPPHLKVHVLEANIPPAPTGPMTPPADATRITSPITLPWEIVSLDRLPNPARLYYPAGAIQEKLEGEVNIALVIAPDGTVASAKVVNGIQMLRDSALDFVQKSKFKPYVLLGTPVEVHTVAHIEFRLQMAQQQRQE